MWFVWGSQGDLTYISDVIYMRGFRAAFIAFLDISIPFYETGIHTIYFMAELQSPQKIGRVFRKWLERRSYRSLGPRYYRNIHEKPLSIHGHQSTESTSL